MNVKQNESIMEMDPTPIFQMNMSFMPSRMICAGVQLSVFSAITSESKTAEQIASQTKCSLRGMTMLLNALTGFKLLEKAGDRYGLTPISERYLVRDSPDYIGAMMEHGDMLWNNWAQLTEVVRTGHPAIRVETKETAEGFFPILVRGLHVLNSQPARQAALSLGIGVAAKGLSVLDVACGSGVWGIAIAEADPSSRITAQDFPGVLNVTREYVERHKVAKQYDYLPGDLKTVDFGENLYDLAILGNIVHSEGERSSCILFRKLHRALKSKGKIVIADIIPNDNRTDPEWPLLFALNMLVNTEEGNTFTFPEYRRWLCEAGFSHVEEFPMGKHINSDSPLVVAYKD